MSKGMYDKAKDTEILNRIYAKRRYVCKKSVKKVFEFVENGIKLELLDFRHWNDMFVYRFKDPDGNVIERRSDINTPLSVTIKTITFIKETGEIISMNNYDIGPRENNAIKASYKKWEKGISSHDNFMEYMYNK